VDDSGARLASTLNNISMHMSGYIADLGGEFGQFPARLDLHNLTVVIDRPSRRSNAPGLGGGENHPRLSPLSIALACTGSQRTMVSQCPDFLLIDQPTQVYFPSETVYAEAAGSIEKKPKRMRIWRRFGGCSNSFCALPRSDAPGFQIIVTEHATCEMTGFQDALVENSLDQTASPGSR